MARPGCASDRPPGYPIAARGFSFWNRQMPSPTLYRRPGESPDPPFGVSEAFKWIPAFAGTTILRALPLANLYLTTIMTSPITLDDIEALAVGAWILGTGGGGSPYLGLLNMRRLYGEGHRVALMSPLDLDDDDRVAV